MDTMTTIETVTWERLDTLRASAAAAGDDEMVAICDRAMTARDGERFPRGFAPEAVTADRAALAQCVRVIRDTEALASEDA